ncbi:MAG: response regulator [Gammaproteobacteria bacterium]|nr:response regulator [Gammaproteobacteria bacterium]
MSNHGELRVGVDPAWPPFEWFEANGTYVGMGADYLQLISNHLGTPLTPRPGRTWPEVIEAVKSGDVDVIPLIVQTPERAEYLHFTKPYLSTPMVIFTRDDHEGVSDLSRLTGLRVGVVEGYATEAYLKSNYAALTTTPVASVEAGLRGLSAGDLDAFVGYLATGNHTIAALNLNNLKIAATTEYTLNLAMAVRKDLPGLVPILQAALDAIPPNARQAISAKWNPTYTGDLHSWSEILVFAVPVGLLVLSVVIFVVSANRRLKREIVEREKLQKRFQDFAGAAGDWLWEMDEHCRYTYVSGRVSEVTGAPAESYVGKSRRDIVGDDPEWDEYFVAQEARRPFRDFRYRRVTADGRTQYLSTSGTPIFSDDGAFVGYRGVGRDITQETEALQALEGAKARAESAEKLKSEFLANMSHEIRTPMNGVLGMTEVLLKTSLSNQQRRCATTIHRSANALLSVINDVLDFSKIEAGKLALQHGPFDVRQIVEDLGALFAEAADRKGLELICAIPPTMATGFLGDAGRIRQVLTNLLGNALKFTHAGEVIICVSVDEKSSSDVPLIRFEVQDTGIGISEDAQKHIFESFAQADGSTSRRFGGTGLGLTISAQLVQLMGGRLDVWSAPDEGASFHFSLPLEQDPSTASSNDREQKLPSGARILAVDDNATNRQLYAEQLSSWGAEFDCVASGANALVRLKAALTHGRPYAVVLLDMHMPGMDGIDLARAMTRDPMLSQTPCILLSSIADLDASEYHEVGIETYLAKPVRQNELFRCLMRTLDAREFAGEDTWLDADPTAVPQCHGRLLLVEDNPVNQEVALALLEPSGLTIDVASDGVEAVSAVAEQTYDLIFMDCQMPNMDGFEATKAIRAREKRQGLERVPIVALTGNALEGDREHCLASNMDDYLSKPFTEAALFQVLMRWIPPSVEQVAASGE